MVAAKNGDEKLSNFISKEANREGPPNEYL